MENPSLSFSSSGLLAAASPVFTRQPCFSVFHLRRVRPSFSARSDSLLHVQVAISLSTSSDLIVIDGSPFTPTKKPSPSPSQGANIMKEIDSLQFRDGPTPYSMTDVSASVGPPPESDSSDTSLKLRLPFGN